MMVLHNTLGNITNEYMGSQWALFMPTHGSVYPHPMFESGPFMNSRRSTVA